MGARSGAVVKRALRCRVEHHTGRAGRGRLHDDRGLRSVWLPLGDAILMVERLEAPAERERGAGGWHMLVLDIPAAERARWVKRLEAAGAGPAGSTGFTLYGQDPDGNPFGLSHYPEPAPE